ncbi:putative lipid II flippase FtsW [Lolliginicoccus suaedae]|uniref:putative lipid II flippase FtsW n=1 Tax=Lolliginicoccus suaedae TaxID=2605429 RepID=UPI0011EFCD9D|nr:putative lipid II flippase FtsW [Lolliginicoccus suaedae]
MTAQRAGQPGVIGAASARFGAWLNRPMASFHLILSISALLSILGLVMVLSASSVSEYTRSGSAYSMFIRQLMFITVGWIAFYVALRLPVRFIKRTAFLGVVVSTIMLALVLVPGIGVTVNGARSWFQLAGFAFQPSEMAKIALALWGAVLLGERAVRTRSSRDMLFPLVPGALVIFTLVALQPDFSTLVVLFFILLALLWFAGLPLGYFVVGVGAVLSIAVVMAFAEGYRTRRLTSFLNADDDPLGASYQARQSQFALADGGLFGTSLGQSRAKWKFLPEAHNDFIFAIIGEELGFVGAAAVIGIFGLFIYTGLRIAARSVDPFLRLFVATSTVWVIGQTFINLGYVVGLLPVTGLQLPLISAGGTSAVLTLFMLGIMASAARHEPEAIAASQVAARRSRVPRFLRLPLPEKYNPPRPAPRRPDPYAGGPGLAMPVAPWESMPPAPGPYGEARQRGAAPGRGGAARAPRYQDHLHSDHLHGEHRYGPAIPGNGAPQARRYRAPHRPADPRAGAPHYGEPPRRRSTRGY